MTNEDWRVEVNLDHEEHGDDIGDLLRSQDLDDDARARLGERVYVSRNGSRLFLYAGSEEQATEAESVLRKLAADDNLTADFLGVTRWHPVEQAWKDASLPLPRTEEEVEAELDRREEAERREAETEGSYDWLIKINLPSADEAERVAASMRSGGHPVHRLWRFVTIDVLTEEIANDLVARLRPQLSDDAQIWVEGNLEDVPKPHFVFIESRLRDPF